MNMKKLILLLIGFSAHAAQAGLFTGFYVAADVGATAATFNVDQTLIAAVPGAVTLSRPSDLKLQGSNAAGLIGLGYAYEFDNHFVLGAEATAGLTHAENEHINELDVNAFGIQLKSTVKATLKNDFAIIFKPGYVFKEKTQFYALVGPRWGNFTTSVDTHFMFNFGSLVQNSGSDKVSGYTLGITAGLGVQRLITDHFSAGLEYAYTSYGNIDSPHTNISIPSPPNDGTVVDDPDIDASSNTVMATLTYRF
jgi:opacity protein-like surface antigen